MSEGHIERLNKALEGRYRIERQIGEGGMATVYLADDLRHERQVALKVLKPELAAVVGAERFLAEIKTTAKLQHPHILPLFDSGEADKFLFYVMPYVEGESLRQRLDRERQLGVQDALSLTRKVADALDYAHGQGIVHRDIKPGNILLSQRGEPLIGDFGIALAVAQAGGGRITETGLSLGTPHYMSPEQATGDRDVDPRSDVYALGCVLYEMLSGEPPFTASSAQAILAKILTMDAPSITLVRRTVPPNVGAALAKAMEKLPADRFASAADFAAALDDPGFTYEGRPRTATTPSSYTVPTAQAARWLRDRRSVAAVAVALVLAVAAAWGWLGRAPQVTQPTYRFPIDLGGLIPDLYGDLVISPDGSWFAVAGARGNERGLFLRRSDDAEFRLLAGTEDARFPAFSPDGAWLAYVNISSGAIERIATSGAGAPLTVVPGSAATPATPMWGDDGTVVFRRNGIMGVHYTGGAPELLLEQESVPFYPRLLPGGRAVLLTDRSSGSGLSVTLLDLETDSVRVLIAEGLDATYVPTGHIVYAHPEGGLNAVPFDLESLSVTGEPVPLLSDVSLVTPTTGAPLRAQYSVSDNGTLIYRTGGPDARLYELSVVWLVDGRTDTLPLPPGAYGPPRWSSDGRSIAYSLDDDIWTYDVERAAPPRQVTFEGTNGAPEWSPDGTRLAFASRRDDTDGFDLFVKTLTDDRAPQRLFTLPGNQTTRGWTDGDVIAFESGGPTELWWIDAGGGEPTPYLADGNDNDDIAISPDGRWAAYQCCDTPVEATWVRRFPEPGQQISISDGEGQFPRWSRDGRTIYYWAAENAVVDTLFAAQVVTEPTFAVTGREPVLSGDYVPEWWDLHPDGDRIVVARPQGDEADVSFTVVTNWFEELRERFPD